MAPAEWEAGKESGVKGCPIHTSYDGLEVTRHGRCGPSCHCTGIIQCEAERLQLPDTERVGWGETIGLGLFLVVVFAIAILI